MLDSEGWSDGRIDAELERLEAGDSNDEHIDVLTEIVRDLQEQRRAEREAELLALWFTPQCIRDHFEGDDSPAALYVAAADDAELARIGGESLSDDRLYRTFHEVLQSIAEEAL